MSNPISAIGDFFSGAATRVFEALEMFLLRITVFGVNIMEILLFLLFVSLVVALLVFPVSVYKYYSRFKSSFNRFFGWFKK